MPVTPNPLILVRTLDPTGNEAWRCTSQVLEREQNYLKLEEYFNRKDLPFHGIVLREIDCFIETYYSDHWYNIFEIHNRYDDLLKAWYCHISYPAIIENNTISYIDLALDLLVYSERQQLILDDDECAALSLPATNQAQARAALMELQQCVGLVERIHQGFLYKMTQRNPI